MAIKLLFSWKDDSAMFCNDDVDSTNLSDFSTSIKQRLKVIQLFEMLHYEKNLMLALQMPTVVLSDMFLSSII